MEWFEIKGSRIVRRRTGAFGCGDGDVWGIRIGGRWHLDYTWKLMFGIGDAEWAKFSRCIFSDSDFYRFCDAVGVRYRMPGDDCCNDGACIRNQ